MALTCEHVMHMKSSPRATKMIQVRHVPDALHRRLKARAATAGMSLSDYLVAELRRIAERPTRDELLARLASRTPVRPSQPVAALLRAERDRR
jgi:plasmid stability protein